MPDPKEHGAVTSIKAWQLIVGVIVALVTGGATAYGFVSQFLKKETFYAHVRDSRMVHDSFKDADGKLSERATAAETQHVGFKEDLTDIRKDVRDIKNHLMGRHGR